MTLIETGRSKQLLTSQSANLPDKKAWEEKTAPPLPVVRAIMVAPISVASLAERLQNQTSVNDFSFTEVILGQKSDKSTPSPNYVMPFGGFVDRQNGEQPFLAALREIEEETTVLSLSTQPETIAGWTGVRRFQATQPFTYSIPGYLQPREVQFLVIPVQSKSSSLHYIREGRNGTDDKFQQVLTFSPTEFMTLIEAGSLDPFRMPGHLTKKAHTEIDILDLQAQKRAIALDAVMHQVGNFEITLREKTLSAVNLIRRLKGQPKVVSLDDCPRDEIVSGFAQAQMRLALADERQRRLKNARAQSRFTDLLKANSVLAAEGVSREIFAELLKALPTKESRYVVNTFGQAFQNSFQTIVQTVDPTQLTRTETGFSYTYPFAKVFADIWPQVIALPLPERVGLLTKANLALEEELARMLQVDAHVIREAQHEANGFMHYISANLQKHQELREQVKQEHRPMNEINNAKLFTLGILALGHHPNLVVDSEVDQAELHVIRFEAMRQLALFGVGVEALLRIKYADNSLFEAALDSFMHFPPERTFILFADGTLHPVNHRQALVDGIQTHLIVEERDKKTFWSAMRKLIQDGELRDIFTVNFVLADDNINENYADIETRIALAGRFRESLLTHVAKELGSDWQVSIYPGSHKTQAYANLRRYIDLPPDQRPDFIKSLTTGKRAGSRGNLIVREKMIVVLKKEGENHEIEVCIYPFETMRDARLSDLSRAGFWGFAEKIYDDQMDFYTSSRVLVRDTDHAPTKPSLYELLLPGSYYDTLLCRVMWHQAPRRKPHDNM